MGPVAAQVDALEKEITELKRICGRALRGYAEALDVCSAWDQRDENAQALVAEFAWAEHDLEKHL